MKYYMVWLSTFRSVLIRVKDESDAKQIIANGLHNWPKAQLGFEVKIYDELPEKEN